MKRIVAISCFGIIGMLGITCILSMNNTNENVEKITTVIEENAPTNEKTIIYETTNNYETHNHYEEVTKEVDEEEVKEMVHDAYFEERVRQAEEESKQLTYEELQALIYDGSNNNAPNKIVTKKEFPNEQQSGAFMNNNIRCEVCEKNDKDLEVWYDVNNIKHYTCKTRCTNGLSALYR